MSNTDSRRRKDSSNVIRSCERISLPADEERPDAHTFVTRYRLLTARHISHDELLAEPWLPQTGDDIERYHDSHMLPLEVRGWIVQSRSCKLRTVKTGSTGWESHDVTITFGPPSKPARRLAPRNTAAVLQAHWDTLLYVLSSLLLSAGAGLVTPPAGLITAGCCGFLFLRIAARATADGIDRPHKRKKRRRSAGEPEHPAG